MRLLDYPPRPRPVSLAQSWHPSLAQQKPLIEVRPEIKIDKPTIAPQVTIELGGLPLSIGLFAASGLAFLVRAALPEGWPKTVGLLTGSALAMGGIVNLLLPKPPKPSAPAAPPAPYQPVAPGAVRNVTREWTPPAEDAFDQVLGTIASPVDQSTIDLGLDANTYPVRVQFQNPTATEISFELIMVAYEFPSAGKEAKTTLPMQVTVPPLNKVSEIDITMPVSTWNFYVGTVKVVLDLYKRRFPGAEPILLDTLEFTID